LSSIVIGKVVSKLAFKLYSIFLLWTTVSLSSVFARGGQFHLNFILYFGVGVKTTTFQVRCALY